MTSSRHSLACSRNQIWLASAVGSSSASAEAFQPGKYRYENGKILEDPDFTPPVDNTALLNQIGELKAELSETDYKALKYMEGWLTEEEYAPIKAQRQALRDQINELETQL